VAVVLPILADAIAVQAGARSAPGAVGVAAALGAAAAAGTAAPAQQEGEQSPSGATTAAVGDQLAAAAAAASPLVHGSKRLQQQLYCMLVAALKYTQASAALQGSAQPGMHTFYTACRLLIACRLVTFRMLEDCSSLTLCMPPSAAAEADEQLQSEQEQQLLWLDVLGRLLVAAGRLLQQVTQHVSASGNFTIVDNRFPKTQRFALQAEFMQGLLQTTMAYDTFGVLGQGDAAAVAVAAATQEDLVRLLQQAATLQEQVLDTEALFSVSYEDGAQGMQSQLCPTSNRAMQQLHAACQEGLPQQLYSFGVAYCAAFPQRGCCGNPACTNLDKFTETALASQGCSGCDKVSQHVIFGCRVLLNKVAYDCTTPPAPVNGSSAVRYIIGMYSCY
jgi:hypothetical protein